MVQEQDPGHQALLTHGLANHAAGARYFSELTGCRARAVDPAHRIQGTLDDGEVVEADDCGYGARTPGHTADSVSFHLLRRRQPPGHRWGGTTVIVGEDGGDLGDYLNS